MTSKRKQIKKIPISIFFSDNQIPKKFKKSNFEEFSFYSVLKSHERILITLKKMSDLNRLQKNHRLLLIGLAIRKYIKSGDFFIDYFGCKKTDITNFFLGWYLADYSFDKFKSKKKTKKNNAKIHFESLSKVKSICDSYFYVRDLINTPANILGPKEIFNSAKKYLKKFNVVNLTSGKTLEKNFPLISAVGVGANLSKQPIFCEFKSKKKYKKKIFLIGKGVSFDTGGLNIKTGSGMSLMKKDMGGAANCIGLAKLVSEFGVGIDLHLLLCLVENSISKKSMRPSDIIKSREGSFVEVGDTDAEGRLILADAITFASERKPDLIIDMATLTGASRVAMGVEVPSFFCNDDDLAMKLIDSSKKTGDPLWQLPLWDNYSNQLNSEHADFKNIGNSVFGGAITAALFLQKFVKNTPWIHIDLMAWTRANKYCSYEGGEAMGIRALLDFLKRF